MADLQSSTPVAIIGAGGFTGRELLSLLRSHPQLLPVHLTSNAYAGKPLAEIFPELDDAFPNQSELVFRRHDDPLPAGASVFLAVPNDTSLALVPDLLKAGHRVVDLSGAFRLHDQAAFERTYKLTHNEASHAALGEAVFGLPEILREPIKGARFVSNPGCFPTGSVVPLALLGEDRKRLRHVVIDAKSGVSGAGGRTEDGGFLFHKVHENFRAYKILGHQHQPEIEEYAEVPVVFTPHLLPLYRGILSTIVLLWDGDAPAGLADRFRERCAAEPFLRFCETPEAVELTRVQNTNYVDIGLRSDGATTVIVTAIDNLVKGAAGQAIQNLNLMLGLPETAGLLGSANGA